MVVTEQALEAKKIEADLPPIYTDLIPPELINLSLQHNEDNAQLAAGGALVVSTGEDTGRSPKDKYIVAGSRSDEIAFGNVNKPLSPESFRQLGSMIMDHYKMMPHLFEQNVSIGADPQFTRNIQLISEKAWATLFGRNLFRPYSQNAVGNGPALEVYHAPYLKLNGEIDGIHGDKAIALDFDTGRAFIVGTRYAGEIKKAMFTMMQGILPQYGVATLHCSANQAANGETALFFGLSGTGKTTLSMDEGRSLIGDDEHVWTDNGIFNMEGGSYAKVINLQQESEPAIWTAVQRYGSVLENVQLDEEKNPIFSDGVENMRGAFPLAYFPDVVDSGMGRHPSQILFLTADASGVMPLAARLDYDQAMYNYITGYTSKLAGTELGVTEPQPEFSACYGKPFLPLSVARHVQLFGNKLRQYQPEVWLINTGWPGRYGSVDRVPIAMTRAIVRAILNHEVSDSYDFDGMGNRVPQGMRGILPYQLRAESYYRDPDDYKDDSRKLALAMYENSRQFVGSMPKNILSAGPHYRSA